MTRLVVSGRDGRPRRVGRPWGPTALVVLGLAIGPALVPESSSGRAARLTRTFVPTVLAHDVPSDVTLHAFLRPEGRQLRFLVRVPLLAMRDVDVPTRGVGYLDLDRAEPALRSAATLWITQNVAWYENDRPVGAAQIAATRVSLPTDRAFATYDQALAHVLGPPLPSDTELYWEQGLLDVLVEYPLMSAQPRLAMRTELDRLGLRVTTNLRLVLPDSAERAFQFHEDPGLVQLDPRWSQAVWRFTVSGFEHILDGIDHLLFLFCLVLPLRRVRPLVAIATGFTVAHSITLIASAFGMAPGGLWFPPLVETLIAASIVYMGLENIVQQWNGGGAAHWARLTGREAEADAGAGASHPRPPRFARRWAVTFGFGLIHGFGFSFALRDSLQLAGSHLLTSLFSFNLGVELGQVLVLLILVPFLALLFRFVVAEPIGIIIMSALVVHTAWHWMIDRGATLGQYQFQWPAFDLNLLAALLRWGMLVVFIAGVAWVAFGLLRLRESAPPAPSVER